MVVVLDTGTEMRSPALRVIVIGQEAIAWERAAWHMPERSGAELRPRPAERELEFGDAEPTWEDAEWQ